MVKGHPAAMKHTCLITFTAKAPFIKGTLPVTAGNVGHFTRRYLHKTLSILFLAEKKIITAVQ